MKGVFVGGSTGGHVYPALAVARESKRKGTEIYWIGKKNSLEQKLSLEEEFFFKSVPSGGFRGKRFYEKIVSFLLLCSSFIVSFRALTNSLDVIAPISLNTFPIKGVVES